MDQNERVEVFGNILDGNTPVDDFDFDQEVTADAIAAGPTDHQTKQISELVQELCRLEDEIARDDKALEAKKRALFQVQTKDLPAAMELAGVKEQRLLSGQIVRVGDEYYASISEENAPAAFAWLREHQHEALIKNEIKLQFGKGEDERADLVKKQLEEQGLPFNQKQSVHPSTLKAFVKEQITKEIPIPEKTFGIHHERVAKVVRPKAQ